MIPILLHMIWVNNDSPIESVQAAASSWAATGLPLRVWTQEALRRDYGRVIGPENVQANYYRVRILGEHGGFYVDADSYATVAAGDVLRRVLPTTNLVAATLPNGQYNNAPIGAAAGLPDWDSLAIDPVNHFHRWNEYLRRQSDFVTLNGWNGTEGIVAHKIGSLKKSKPLSSIRTFPQKDGWLKQEADDWQFTALRKSGHHAVLHWATNLTGRTTWHFNDCEKRAGLFRPGNQFVLREGDVPPLRACNFEDSDLANLDAATRFIVIRHPWNCFASRIKGGAPLNTAIWKEHAKAFLSGEFIGVNFDRWHASVEYRKSIADKLYLFFVDDRDHVPEIGRSMFDGRKFDGRASEMAVLSRWQEMKDHPDLQRIMADEELIHFWQRIEAA